MLEDDAVGEAQVAHAVGRDPPLDLVGHRPAGEQRRERQVGARELEVVAHASYSTMVVHLVQSTTMVVEDEFITVAHRIVWCGVATVDRRGRPRSRILHPYWERTGDGVRGWVVTRQSPLKAAHLARAPYVSCTYWDATHDVAIADCHAAWEEDRDEHARVWALYAAAPEPLGYDFHRSGPTARPRPAPRCCGSTLGGCTSPTR